MITSDTLIKSGSDLTWVIDTLEGVRRQAEQLAATLDLAPAHELAATDLTNLRAALAACNSAGGNTLEQLWPVYVFAMACADDNDLPGLSPFTRRVGIHRPRSAVARFGRAHRRRVRTLDRTLQVLDAAISAASEVVVDSIT